MMKLLLIFIALSLSAQTPIYINPVLSAESDGLFNAAGEVSTTINLRLRGGFPAKEFAVQAFGTSVTACTYNVKGSVKAFDDTPATTDFVDLPTPTALNCLTTNDERLHFFANRGIQTLQITLATLTGTSVVFRVLGR